MSRAGAGRAVRRLLAVGILAAAVMLAATAPVHARCPDPSQPLQATLKFDNAPANAVFTPTSPIAVVLQVENCSGAPVLTTDGFSSTDFFRRLYITDPNGGTITNTAEAPLHDYSPVFFCQSRGGVLQPVTIPVTPVEILPGPQREPAVPHFFREYRIPDIRTLYAITQPGHYTMNAQIELLTFSSSSTSTVFADCDQLRSTTVANVATLSGRQPFTIVSNTLEFLIPGTADASKSSISGTSPVPDDGASASRVTITLQDASGDAVVGITPTFSASGSGNIIGPCSATDGSGVSACSLRSTVGEVKTLSIESPVQKTGGTVTFAAACPGLLTRAVDATGAAHAPNNYTTLQAAYNAAASTGEVIGLFGNLTENVVLGADKTLTITQCTSAQITAAASSKPVVDITSTGTLTIVGPATAGGVIGWRVGGNGGHWLKNIRATGASQYGVQLSSNGNTLDGGSFQQSTRYGVLASGSGNTISRTSAVRNGQNGFSVPGSNNLLDTDTATSNVANGFGIDGTGNTVKGSTAQSSGQNGFNVTGPGSLLDGNAATGNTANGFKVAGAGETIKNSVAESNGQDGFNSATTATNALFDSNTANSNRSDGFEINGGGNTLKSNQSNAGASGSTSENGGAEYRLNATAIDGGGNKADGIVIPKTTSPKKCPSFPAAGTCE